QAEDGIRDRNVTGVQTCALPICNPWSSITIDYEMMHCWVVFIGFHQIMFKLLPERKSSFVNKMSFFLEPCTITIHFPPLMHTGNFYFSAFLIFLFAFCI